MIKNISELTKKVKKIKSPVQYNIDYYRKILKEINNINLKSLSDIELKNMSNEMRYEAINGDNLENLLVRAYALVKEVTKRVLKICPFDVQIIAGIAIHEGKIVEMKTGEGKTLTAVMPAYLNSLSGKGVHILTFNDYLAKRDASWMKPVYEFLGMSVGYINEGMSNYERKRAYSCDITYVTAKEAGFDYLRDFLCTDKDNIVHRTFNFAIVDEADSILIDESRIPLVIAGDVKEDDNKLFYLSKVVKNLKVDEEYELDEYGSNISLTESGLLRVEEILGCQNLYELNNLELLTRLNSALHAEVLLKRDKDYIVRNGKIEIVDEFTGRVAEKRHWPYNLQAAVEAKEGIKTENSGRIMGSIPLQYFLCLYKKISGMTGTAVTAVSEFNKFYDLDVVVIPTNKPCIRLDYPDEIFTHKAAKNKALISEIIKAHKTGQPILIGTGSVEESEHIANDLTVAGIKCEVLNAKNDEMEAKIIAKAGDIGAVTVSTNMAGRGIDIKLGGEREESKNIVAVLGGLYVIGTNRHESNRIDNQLKGRSGRQGDPGETRFFISLEDDIIKRYDITRLIPERYIPQKQEEAINNLIVRNEIDRGQRIVQGYNSDIRKQLWNYSHILEDQRQIIHKRRQDILLNKVKLNLLSNKATKRYLNYCSKFDDKVIKKVEKDITLYYINKCWFDYLEYISYIRESIHLVIIGRRNPLDEFHRLAIIAFDEMNDDIENDIINKFNTVEINKNGIDLVKEEISGPSSTWTYLIDDSLDQFSNLPHLIKSIKTSIKGTLFSVKSIYNRITEKKRTLS